MHDSATNIVVCTCWGILLAALVSLVLGRSSLRRRWPGYNFESVKGWVLIAIASATLFLAIIGHLLERGGSSERPESTVTHVLRSAYQTAQIILLNDGVEEDNLPINMARLGSVAVLILVAAETLQLLFAESIQRMLLGRKRGHVVVCGLGNVGSIIVHDLLAHHPASKSNSLAANKRHFVVVVESDRQNGNVDRAVDAGAEIVFGDATDARLLKRINAMAAESIFFVTGSDEDNLEGAADLRELCARRDDLVTLPNLYLHLSYGNNGKFVGEPLFPGPDSSKLPAPVTFNVVRNAAIALLTKGILDYRPDDASQVVHFVIVGFGVMARETVRLIAELGHFENQKRSRMTVFYPPSQADEAHRFREEYPALFPPDPQRAPSAAWQMDPEKDDWSYGVAVADPGNVRSSDKGIEFVVNGSFVEDASAPMAPRFVEGVMSLAQTPGVLPIVILCDDAEETNYTQGRHIRDELKQRTGSSGEPRIGTTRLPVFAYVPQKPMLSKLAGSTNDGLILFGACHEICSYQALTFDLVRKLAEAIAASYDRNAGQPVKAFSQRSPWEQYSNLSTAAHVQIKLAKFNWEVAHESDSRPRVPMAVIPAADELVAAKMEHHRWMAERLMTGWTFGQRDNALKRRAQLVPWALLDEVEVGKDYDQIQTILEFCNGGGALPGGGGWKFKLVCREIPSTSPEIDGGR